MNKPLGILAIVGLAFLTGCASSQSTVEKTQLEIRQFQTRIYETSDHKMVMKAVMHALQDDGFIVKEANLELGLLTAQKELDVEDKTEAFFAVFFAGMNARYKKNSITEASANISEHNKAIKVRVNFQNKVLNNQGDVMKVEHMQDEQFYRNFFAKVDKSVFLGKEKID